MDMVLTAEQLAVVEHEGLRLAVTGGAGTGKTTALAARYRRLVAGAAPARVLVVCPDRATAQRFWEGVQPDLRGHGFDALPVTSPLSLAYDLVTRAGRPVDLVLGGEQRALVRSLLADEDPAGWPLLGHLMARPGFAGEVVDGLDVVWEMGVDAAAAAGGRWAELAGFARRYRAVLEHHGRLDVTTLLAEATALAPSHSSRFDHVLVDDADALRPAAAAGLLAALVGDGVALTAVNPRPAAPSASLNLSQPFRVAAPGRLVRCGHPSVEAEAVAGELLEARSAGVHWADMAVLVRSLGRRARSIGRALARHGVPVVPMPQLAPEEPVVRAVVDLLRWVDGDATAVDRLVVSPLARLDPFTVRAVRRDARESGRPLDEDARLAPLVELHDHLRDRQTAGDTPSDLAYEAWARGLTDLGTTGLGAVDDRALDALVAFVDGLASHGERHPGATLGEALAAWAEGDLSPATWRLSAGAGPDGVTITSIAAAAGRDWHTVVVAGCVEGELPRAVSRTPVFDPAALGRTAPGLADERALFALATSRATTTLVATAAPEPGVLLSRFVEAWKPDPDGLRLPLAPGRVPPVRSETAGAAPVWPSGVLTLSATQLDTYDDCPLRYAYAYGLKARDEAGVHANLGTLVHEVLAEFLRPGSEAPRTLDGLMAVANAVWTDEVARYRPQIEEARRDFVAMLKGWWETEGADSGRFPDVVDTERRFDVPVGPHRLAGSIDRIDRVAGGIRVVDYKTGKKEPSGADVAEDLQLATYHLAATRDEALAAEGPPVQLELRYLRSQRTYQQPITAGHEASTQVRILATADAIVGEEFLPSVHANCRNCAFHRLCPLQDAGREVGDR
ncbi:MAG: PD-(D/E)XK nuclease family protein [Acidimicrobiales bacterium]